MNSSENLQNAGNAYKIGCLKHDSSGAKKSGKYKEKSMKLEQIIRRVVEETIDFCANRDNSQSHEHENEENYDQSYPRDVNQKYNNRGRRYENNNESDDDVTPDRALNNLILEYLVRRIRCWQCGNMGHKMRECNQINNESQRHSQNTTSCYLCDEIGHFARHCPTDKRYSNQEADCYEQEAGND